MCTIRRLSNTFLAVAVAAVAAMLIVLPVKTWAGSIGGVDVADTLAEKSESLVLNGAGKRTKLALSLYVASLYLKTRSDKADAIVHADEPMAISLTMTSSLINADRMEKAIREGFDSATGGNTISLLTRIDAFIKVFDAGIADGDVFVMAYTPGSGTAVYRNGAAVSSFDGLDFKQALFGIWLGERPVQKKLRKSLLGG